MTLYFLGLLAFLTPFSIIAMFAVLDWQDIKEKWNKDSVQERDAAKRAKTRVIWALGMFVWFLTVPVLIVYGLYNLFRALDRSENNTQEK